MPRAYPEEFRRDVVEIARRNETPIAQIAKDFDIFMENGQRHQTRATITEVANDCEIFEACLRIHLRKNNVECGSGPCDTFTQPSENPEFHRCINLFEEKNEVSRRQASHFPETKLPCQPNY